MTAKKELTREEVSLRIGCSIGTVQKFEREGKLHPRRDAPVPPATHGRVWFDPVEVEKVAKSYKPTRAQRIRLDEKLIETNVRGKVAAKALPMFEAGSTLDPRILLAQVCAATESDPMLIIQLYETWKLGPEGVIALRKKEKQEAEQAAREREEQKRHDWLTSRREWIAMRLEVAKLEGKRPFALPRLDHSPEGKKEKAG